MKEVYQQEENTAANHCAKYDAIPPLSPGDVIEHLVYNGESRAQVE